MSDLKRQSSVMKTGVITGEYSMDSKDGERACAIADCGTMHRNGYIILLPNGDLSYIGHKCGVKYFGKEWLQVRRKQYQSARNKQAKQSALEEALKELAERIRTLPLAETAETAWARAVLASFDELPTRLRDTLINRASQNDREILETRDETEAEVAKRRFITNDTTAAGKIPKRITKPIGTLVGLPGISQYTRLTRRLDIEIPAAISAAQVLLSSHDASTSDVKSMLTRIESAIAAIPSAVKHLRAFVDQSNLDLLPRLRDAQFEGIERVEYVHQPMPSLRVVRRG